MQTLRCGACYAELDGGEPGWTLAPLATDQDPPHAGDTIGIARALKPRFELTHPHVQVLEPLVLTCAPHVVTDELEVEVERLVRAAGHGRDVDRVVVLPQGGTPATRVLLEHVVGRVLSRARTVERLLPDGRGGTHTHSLLRTIAADFVARQHHDRLRDAIEVARYAIALQRAEDLVELGLASDELVRWCDAGRRIVDDQPDWARGLSQGDDTTRLRRGETAAGRLGAMTEVIGRLQRSGALRDALTTFVTATELLSIAWCEEIANVDGAALGQLRWAKAGNCLLRARPAKSASVSDRARHAAVCATMQCGPCPLRHDAAGQAARAVRERSSRLVQLRNDIVRVNSRDLDAKLQRSLGQGHRVSGPGVPDREADRDLRSLLADAARAALGAPPPDPLRVVDERIEALLR